MENRFPIDFRLICMNFFHTRWIDNWLQSIFDNYFLPIFFAQGSTAWSFSLGEQSTTPKSFNEEVSCNTSQRKTVEPMISISGFHFTKAFLRHVLQEKHCTFGAKCWSFVTRAKNFVHHCIGCIFARFCDKYLWNFQMQPSYNYCKFK